MNTFRRLVFTAVIAGLISGGLATFAHYFGTAPIIARAEIYEIQAHETQLKPAIVYTQERGATITDPQSHRHAADSPAMPNDNPASFGIEWQPGSGLERTMYTALADMVTAVAFSLILVAAFELHGEAMNWRKGLFWGLAGFLTFTLAPGLGLPPELPGIASAPIHIRQLWWVATASATACGLGLVFLQHRVVWTLAGVMLLVAPHFYGAPQPLEYGSTTPELLSRQFTVIATATSLLFWILLGTLSGFFFELLQRYSSMDRRFASSILARRG